MTAAERAQRRDAITRTRRGVVAEAEALCAQILRNYPAAEQSSVIATMYLESRSMSTVQNAQNVTTMIRRLGFHRALLVTSAVMREGAVVEDHAHRGAAAFRGVRGEADTHRIASVSCPYSQGSGAVAVADE
jgi:hypothetical protein